MQSNTFLPSIGASIRLAFSITRCLPEDGYAGTLIGRVWRNGIDGAPAVVKITAEGIFDISDCFPSMSTLLDAANVSVEVADARGEFIGTLAEILVNSVEISRDPNKPYFLAPCDLQVIKACGVTFAVSMLERVIEEQAGGIAEKANNIRQNLQEKIGCDLSTIKPGSSQALSLKAVLQAQGIWSQYLEVGIGTHAEVFTKAPVLSAIGTGGDIGVRSDSSWNNPEPEVVLAVNSRGEIVGASLGNDVNLRDIEGKSALLLGKAKDNNASCSIGPFIRVFDQTFNLDDVRKEVIELRIEGQDKFVLTGTSSMANISRDPIELVNQTMQAHQYPDGFMLFLGTMFSPSEDRDSVGLGFTHKLGDFVYIRSPMLGELANRVTLSEMASPWQFGLRSFFNAIAKRNQSPKRVTKWL
jgi:fumarylacetoacetate (FAA) hydrolase family protein